MQHPANASNGNARRLGSRFLAPALVVLFALIPAWFAYASFLKQPRQLWNGAPHDRNAHYLLGQSLALDVSQHDWANLLHDLDSSRMWGPLHGFLVGLIELAGGIDFRLAVLPSLIAWVGTALLGFLVARRVAPVGGTVAGMVAVLFVLASPSHRAFATDVMLESLGACLSLLIVYFYLVTVQEPERQGWRSAARWLGLSLTLLFLLKYNYWVLAVVTLVVAEFARRPRYYLQVGGALYRAVAWREWLRVQWKRPSNYVIVGLLIPAVYIACTGGGTITLGHRQIHLRSSHNFIHLAYIVFFCRCVRWWWQAGRSSVRGLGEPAAQVACWHLWPAAVWFLLPKRLGYFFHYISPANGANYQQGVVDGLLLYWRCLTQDYHVGLTLVVLALVLTSVTVLMRRRLRPGGAVVLWFLLIATLLTVHHPNRKGRFLHSWVAITWITAGAGVAYCCYPRRGSRAGRWLAPAATAGLACTLVPCMFLPAVVPDSGRRAARISDLTLTDSYLPYLADSRRAVILCNNMAMKQLAQWTYLERYRNLHGVEVDIRGFGEDYVENSQAFERWLETTHCDTLVYIDVPERSTFYVRDGHYPYEQVMGFLEAQSIFSLSRKVVLAPFESTVSIWSRK
jgi:hypothetical protein